MDRQKGVRHTRLMFHWFYMHLQIFPRIYCSTKAIGREGKTTLIAHPTCPTWVLKVSTETVVLHRVTHLGQTWLTNIWFIHKLQFGFLELCPLMEAPTFLGTIQRSSVMSIIIHQNTISVLTVHSLTSNHYLIKNNNNFFGLIGMFRMFLAVCLTQR